MRSARYHETLMKTIQMELATGCISDQSTVPGLTCPSKARRWRIWFCHFVVWLMPLEMQTTWFSLFSQMPSLKNGDGLHGHCGYWIAFPIRKYRISMVKQNVAIQADSLALLRVPPLNISSLWVHRYDTLPLLKPAPPQRYKSAAWTRSITVVVSYLIRKASDASDTIQ